MSRFKLGDMVELVSQPGTIGRIYGASGTDGNYSQYNVQCVDDYGWGFSDVFKDEELDYSPFVRLRLLEDYVDILVAKLDRLIGHTTDLAVHQVAYKQIVDKLEKEVFGA